MYLLQLFSRSITVHIFCLAKSTLQGYKVAFGTASVLYFTRLKVDKHESYTLVQNCRLNNDMYR